MMSNPPPPPSSSTAGPWRSWLRTRRAWQDLGHLPIAVDDPAQRRQVEQQALTLLLQGRRFTLLITFFGQPLGAWLLQDYIGMGWAWGTTALVYLVSLEHWWHLHRAQKRGDDDPAPWARGVIWRVALVGLLLNGWSWPAVDAPQLIATIYALSIALTVVTSAMTQYCVWPAAVTAYVTPVLLGIGWRLWWVPDSHRDGRLVGGVFMVAVWALLLLAARRFAHAMHSDLLTRLRNETLLAEVQDKRQQAEAANAAKSRFLAAASHDLRQPVHAMQLLSSALADQLTGSPQAPLARQVVGGVANFSELVDEILDLARIDAGAVQAHLQPTPVRAICARAEATFRASAQGRGLALWLRLPQSGPQPAVLADPALLWRVTGNLVANALRYTPSGAILLAVRRTHMPDDGRPAWRFEVRDSGLGVAAHQRPLIFDEFYQAHDLDRTHSGGDAGHGLGLSVAQRMAALMGTRVHLHPASRHGRGSVFSITLPAAPPVPPALAPEPASARPPPRLHGLRALVVDDDPASCLALRALLQGWGVHVTAVASAREARAVALCWADAGTPLHALITDHWLADGARSHEVLAAVRAHAPAVHAAVVSGGASDADGVELARRGVQFWRKPLHPERLRDWLEAIAAAGFAPASHPPS